MVATQVGQGAGRRPGGPPHSGQPAIFAFCLLIFCFLRPAGLCYWSASARPTR